YRHRASSQHYYPRRPDLCAGERYHRRDGDLCGAHGERGSLCGASQAAVALRLQAYPFRNQHVPFAAILCHNEAASHPPLSSFLFLNPIARGIVVSSSPEYSNLIELLQTHATANREK